ncbi:MAG: hypothetical protein RTU30_13030 [Candidatus Thorarchaeota archaeon]
MSVDVVGLILVGTTLLVCMYTTAIIHSNYRRLGTEFFKYAMFATSCLCFMLSAYFFPVIFNAEIYHDLVWTGQIYLASFGMLAIAFLVHGLEDVKKAPNDSIINGGYILAGAVAVSRFLPDEYDLFWDGAGWVQQYGLVLVLISAAFFLYVMIVSFPVILRVSFRIRTNQRYKRYTRGLFIGFAVSLALYGILVIAGGWLSSDSVLLMRSHFILMAFILLALLAIIELMKSNPTVFFASSHDIVELQFIDRSSGEVIYCFHFDDDRKQKSPRNLSGAHETIQVVFEQALPISGQIRSIIVEDTEVLSSEGQSTVALLVTKKGTLLLYNLLKLIQLEFESLVEDEGQEFDDIVTGYFQFALPVVRKYDTQ